MEKENSVIFLDPMPNLHYNFLGVEKKLSDIGFIAVKSGLTSEDFKDRCLDNLSSSSELDIIHFIEFTLSDEDGTPWGEQVLLALPYTAIGFFTIHALSHDATFSGYMDHIFNKGIEDIIKDVM